MTNFKPQLSMEFPRAKMLGIDIEFSKIVDDEVERKFLDKYIKRWTSDVLRLSDNTPLPNFTTALAREINKNHLKSTTPVRIAKK